jgi:arginyl-tRNA synthetase
MTKQLQKIIFEVLLIVCKKQNIKINILEKNIEVFQTQNEKFGDFTSNILMMLKRQNINIASQEFVHVLKDHDFVKTNIDSVEYVDPGFINFKIKEEFLTKNLSNFLQINKSFFKQDCVKKYLIEHTSPNTNKALHIGHLRNNVYAMATYRLLVATGNKVVLDCVYNDRGVHICKAI